MVGPERCTSPRGWQLSGERHGLFAAIAAATGTDLPNTIKIVSIFSAHEFRSIVIGRIYADKLQLIKVMLDDWPGPTPVCCVIGHAQSYPPTSRLGRQANTPCWASGASPTLRSSGGAQSTGSVLSPPPSLGEGGAVPSQFPGDMMSPPSTDA